MTRDVFPVTQPEMDTVHICWPNPTQPTFRNTVLRKDTVNSLGYNLQYETRCPKCLTARAEQHGVSEIAY